MAVLVACCVAVEDEKMRGVSGWRGRTRTGSPWNESARDEDEERDVPSSIVQSLSMSFSLYLSRQHPSHGRSNRLTMVVVVGMLKRDRYRHRQYRFHTIKLRRRGNVPGTGYTSAPNILSRSIFSCDWVYRLVSLFPRTRIKYVRLACRLRICTPWRDRHERVRYQCCLRSPRRWCPPP